MSDASTNSHPSETATDGASGKVGSDLWGWIGTTGSRALLSLSLELSWLSRVSCARWALQLRT